MVNILANIGSQGAKSQKEEKQPQKEAPKELNEAYTKIVAYGKHIYTQESNKEEQDRKSEFYFARNENGKRVPYVDKYGNEFCFYKRKYKSSTEQRRIQQILDDLLAVTTIEFYEVDEEYSNFVIFISEADSEVRLTTIMVLMETLSGYSYDAFNEWQKGQDESTLHSIIKGRKL